MRLAMTLIEVVVGLVILGTILASLAIARGRFARQWAAADRKLTAAKALDGLIAEWMQRPFVPLNRQGPLPGTMPGTRDFIWRTTALRNRDAAPLLAAIVRVEVFDRDEKRDQAPIVIVDLLVHAAPRVDAEAR